MPDARRLRGIDEEIWKAARVDGIPMWKTYLFIVIPMMRPVLHHHPGHRRCRGIVKLYDLVVAHDRRRPGHVSEVPGEVRLRVHVPAQNLGLGFAASTVMLLTVAIIVFPGPISSSDGKRTWLILTSSTTAMAGAVDRATAPSGPRRPSPANASRRNIILYGTLIVAALYYLFPLYVMVVTSLKGMPEIRLGNIFSPPLEITFQPWVKAWNSACTGLNCDGLSRASGTRCKITVPSVIVSIAIASVNGYALAIWRFKGANFFFAVLAGRLVHPLPGDALPAGDHHCATRHLTARCAA